MTFLPLPAEFAPALTTTSPMGAPSSSLDALWQDLEAHTAGKPLVKAAAMHHLQQVSDLLQAGSQLYWPSVRTCIAMLCRTDDAALIGRLVTGWSVQEFHWMLHTCNLFTGEALAVAVLHAYCNGCLECACRVQMPAHLPTAAQLGHGLPQRHVLCIPSILLCLQQLSSAPGAERGSQSCAEAVGSRPPICVSQHPASCLQPTRTLCASSDASTAWWPNRDPVALQRRPGCAAAGWGMPKVTLLSHSLYLHFEHPYHFVVVPHPAFSSAATSALTAALGAGGVMPMYHTLQGLDCRQILPWWGSRAVRSSCQAVAVKSGHLAGNPTLQPRCSTGEQ